MARFKRILLKLSGESLMGEQRYGIDEKRLAEYAQQIKEIHDMGVQIGIVIGGGNIFLAMVKRELEIVKQVSAKLPPAGASIREKALQQ